MGYFKNLNGDTVSSINTVDQVETGNISEDEYMILRGMFKELHSGKVIHDNGDGTYSYVDNPVPPDPDPDIDDGELLNILMGVTE